MDEASAKYQINALVNILRLHNHHYYVMDNPIITDDEYDQLRNQLLILEQTYPNLVHDNTPSGTVGGIDVSFGDTCTHEVPMLSLGNALNMESLVEFIAHITDKADILGGTPEVILEYKFDGVAASLIYTYGVLTRASTRGDGLVGEIVTDRVREILNVPQVINELSEVEVFEVRGEVIMPKAGFEKYNESARVNNERVFSNPRNAAAGSLRQKTTKGAPRPLAFYAYSINQGLPDDIIDQREALTYASSLGFTIGPFWLANNIVQVTTCVDAITEYRDNIAYEIDGIVIKVNAFSKQKVLGSRAREPRWAIAYKFPAKHIVTSLENVTWQVGRMGQITPVGHLTPVHIGGVMVSKVSLHNPAELGRLQLMINDTVTLQRAGDVIPKITKVWTDLRDESVMPIIVPSQCPSCSGAVELSPEGTLLNCVAGLRCPDQAIGYLTHFVSKECMDIDGIAEGTLQRLIAHSLVSTPDTLYELKHKVEELSAIEGMGEKTITTLLNNIERSKQVTLQKFIYALGINNVGVGTSSRLERVYPTLNDFLNTTLNELLAIKDIGPITANSIYLHLRDDNHCAVITKLIEHGVTPHNASYLEPGVATEPAETWVITGTFNVPRDHIVKTLAKRGISVAKSVTSNTSCLLVGDNGTSSSKYKKAVKLGTPIVTSF